MAEKKRTGGTGKRAKSEKPAVLSGTVPEWSSTTVISQLLGKSRPPRGGEQKQRRRKGRETISPPPLPTKNFHPRISVNTRPSGIFLTE